MRLSGRFLLAGATALTLASLASGQCPPSANDCCAPSPDGTPGCADTTCCDTVCAADPFCCDVQWDSICAGEAATMCKICGGGSSCPPSANDCCAPSPDGTPGCSDTTCCDLVCANDPFCCDVAWDSLCSGAAATLCEGCAVGCPPSANDCCAPSPDGTPGCADEACCSLVCANDPFCCDVAWDSLCSDAAISLCGCEITCPENPDSCFSPHGLPGCNDPECCNLVCAVDPFCCQVAWDGICVNEAFAFCPPPSCDLPPCEGNPEQEECGQDTNGGCNVPIIGDSNCCQAHGGLGCDDPDCSAAVCSVDPFCCDVAWDGICADEAVAFCPDTCMQGTANFELIECNKTICGTAWADANFRDTDWYEITLTDEPGTLLSVSIINQLPMVIGIVDTGGIPDCALASFLNPFAVSAFCGTASFEVCLPPGVYWVFAAPNGFSGFPCGNGLNDYQLTVNCLGKCQPPECGNAGHDCLTVGGPFCDDADCCFAICAVDPFCCDVSWDATCVFEAGCICYDADICPDGAGHDCYTTGNPGCDDQECCNDVCCVDSFCCQVAWDSICVNEAFAICGVPTCPLECICTDKPEGEPCGEDLNGGCNVPVVGDSTCCFASGGLGCDDPDCQAAVCAVDPFCCDVAWDGICAGEAADLCPDLCQQGTPQFGSICCSETICGTAWATGGFRDTDWFQIEVDQDTPITIYLESVLPMVGGVVATGGIPDCSLASFLDPFVVTGFCGSGSVSGTLTPGTWWIFAAPNSFDGFPCDDASNSNLYRLTLQCFDAIRKADFNCNNCVDGDDLGTLLGLWGPGGGFSEADFDCNGDVDGDDLGTLLGEWGGARCE